jgi:hypothetical protein
MFAESKFGSTGRTWTPITITKPDTMKKEFRNKKYGGEVGSSIVSAYNGKNELEYQNSESVTKDRIDYFAIAYSDR